MKSDPRNTVAYNLLKHFNIEYGTTYETFKDDVKTFDGWLENGRSVKKGEKSFKVYSGRNKYNKICLSYYFHKSQTQSIEERENNCGVRHIEPEVYMAMIQDGLVKKGK